MQQDKVEAYISEFVGTFFLVLTVGFNVLQNTALAPISIGAILMCMIFATGKVSGGHFNPAVTLGVYCRGKIDGDVAFWYALTQISAGIAAGCVYLSILGASFSLGPGIGYTLAAVCVVEVLFTAALVFVVLNVATTMQDDGNWYFGLAIGFTVMAAAFAIGPISGCSLNPAVAFGVMVSNFLHTGYLRVSLLVLYTLAPLFGSLVAVAFFQIVRDQEYKLDVSHTPGRSPRPFADGSPPVSIRYEEPKVLHVPRAQSPTALHVPRSQVPMSRSMPGSHASIPSTGSSVV